MQSNWSQPASPADGFDVGMLFVDNTDRGHSNGSQQLSGVRQWLADQGDKPIDQLGLLPLSPSVPQIVAPAGDIDSLPGLGIDVQAFGPPSMNYPSSNSNQGIAPMMGFDSFAQYREPSDPFGSGDQSPWSTTSESLSTSSPASHLLPALSYHLQPPVTVHGQGRRRSCSDPRAGGRDVPQPGINPSLVQSQYLSVPTVPTIHTVAFAPIPLPPVQGRPRASTIGQTHISPPCSTPASSQYGPLLHVPTPRSPFPIGAERPQEPRTVSRSSYSATPFSSASVSPAPSYDLPLPLNELSLASSPGPSMYSEFPPTPSASPVLHYSKLKSTVTTDAIRAASLKRRKKPAKFHCTYPGCGSGFTRANNLHGHIRSHTGERPYTCMVVGCSSAFARENDLKRHMPTHDRVRRSGKK